MIRKSSAAPVLGSNTLAANISRSEQLMTAGVSVAGRPISEEFLIFDGGKLAGTGAASYSVSRTTGPGSSSR
jgi:hypothetical protein